ncbi:MAG: DUF2157 domain-containing protein [Proteobacteria bacterium]|nr:DUF2157 domain-containing protein [Pseudomonadota bacterium]NOG60365.1 DUF2157 domain-containing protein [Pseudomonadota bacterium]
MNSHHNWLHKQLDSWLGDNLINAHQAESLRLRYPVDKERNWASMVIPTAGSIVFALGIILFFAYNWADMSRFIKLVVILASVAISHVAAISMCKDNINNAYSESLHALGTMLFAAAIILIAQIYHIDDYYPNAIILMAIAAMLLAWARDSIIQALMATVLVAFWAGAEVFDYQTTNHISILILLAGILPFAINAGSVVLMFFASAAIMTCYGFNMGYMDGKLLFQGLFFLSCLYLVGGAYLRNTAIAKCASVIRFNGLIVYYILMFILSFKYSINEWHYFFASPENLVESFYYGLPFIGLIIMLVASLYKTSWQSLNNTRKAELVLVCISLAIVSYLGFVYPSVEDKYSYNWVATILVNLTLVAHFIILIVEGSLETNWIKTTIGCVLFSILVFSRFTDLFHSLLLRSAVFILLGIGLFAIGHYYNSQKKQIVEAGHD